MPSVMSISAFVGAHPQWAYAAVFLLALSESIPVVGVIVPGSILIIGIAALIPAGLVGLWPLLAAAVLGAICGDGLAYWGGRRYGVRLLQCWPLNRFPDLLAGSEAFMTRHGGKSLFLGRFTPGVRALLPLLAGMVAMPAHRFYLANLSSALAWAPAHILPGLAIGASVSAAGAAAGRIAVLLALLAAFVWLLVRGVGMASRFGLPILLRAGDLAGRWAAGHDSWVARRIRDLADPARPEIGALALAVAGVLAAAWLFFGVLEDVVSNDPLVQTDRAIFNLLQALRTPAADTVMIAITELGDGAVVLPVTILVAAWLALRRRAWRAAGYLTAAVGFASVLNTGIKLLVRRPRPMEALDPGWGAFSFPSGHSTVNAVLYGFLGFLIARELPARWRMPVMAGAISFAAMIAVSRLYLGVHWLSDVVASVAFAMAGTIMFAIAYTRHQTPALAPRSLALVVMLAVATVGGIHVARHHAADVARYAVNDELPVVAVAAWLGGGWRELPVFRTDLAGEPEEPFTLQWVGDLAMLERALADQGWRRPSPWTLSSLFRWLSRTEEPLELPVVPVTASGRFPALTLVRAATVGAVPGRFVLRLWPADVRIADDTGDPLWIGSVQKENLIHPLRWLTLTYAQPDADASREAVRATIPPALPVRTETRAITADGWDGRVMLVGPR